MAPETDHNDDVKAATLALVVLAMTATPLAGQDRNPDFAPIEDIAGLPRLLLIGDSISIGYTLDTRALLKGTANVHRIPTNGGPTPKGVEHIDSWLGKSKWDVIHFN